MNNRDQEILDWIKQGDDNKALEQLYKSIKPKIRAYILKNSGSIDDANDIFQDAVLIFYRQVKSSLYKEEQEIAGYLYAVSRNLWINKVKKLGRESSITTMTEQDELRAEEDIQQMVLSKERESLIHNVFEKLGGRCKELLVNVIYHKMSMEEIAQALGYANENAAKTAHYKCKQKLIEEAKVNQSILQLLRN